MIQAAAMPCPRCRLDLFDRLLQASCPIVRPSGDIIKCMESVVDGFQVGLKTLATTGCALPMSPGCTLVLAAVTSSVPLIRVSAF